ncbi:hypothetical protein B0H17DRAFT_1108069 [Mycena rosella]|uniref:Uncharacterized protein n=1 Tax=Mycena rosella TaxID=1033263 RepID=A0AAD7BZC3_MYCRO|nr:hypothetical protein B0H17DRAFT_1108069 [Mycena rosella]
MSTKSGSSAVMNAGHSSAKSQKKPMTAISAPHPLLKSSRGRNIWPDQRPMTSDDKKRAAAFDDDPDAPAISRTRQRTSSVTSIETIRLKVKTRVADALLKPKPPLLEAPMAKHSTRKRTHSATSPEGEDDDSGALQTGPRVRQRTDSNSTASGAPPCVEEQIPSSGKVKMPSALKKALKEKFTPAQVGEASVPRETRPSPRAKATSSANVFSAENPPVSFPSKHTIGTGTTGLKALTPVSDLPAQPLQSLSTNTESKRAPIRLPIHGARLNKYNCYELAASEFELAVTFPSSSRSNFEVWDQEDDLFLVGPLSLHLTLKNPAKWAAVPVSHPDVQVLEIRCTSKAVADAPAAPYCTAAAATANKFGVRYAGAKTRSAVGQALPIDPTRGIAIDALWLRTYAALPVPEADAAAHEHEASASANAGRRGWEMQFFVPITTRLFEKRETRAFQVEALISVWGEPLATEVATMSVSHLMREREMVRRA